MKRWQSIRWPLIAAAATLAITSGPGCGGGGSSGGTGSGDVSRSVPTTTTAPPPLSHRPKAASSAPNFVFVLTDDQDLASFRRSIMPKTFAFLVDRGTYFPQSLAAPPLCCPDRAGFITGQYPHNHGVFSNRPGYPELRDASNILPEWLGRAGYRTGIVGKYLNGTREAIGTRPPPGWDETYLIKGYTPAAMLANGERVLVSGYGTNVTTRLSLDFLRRATKPRQPPFFLWVAEHAPHTGHPITNACSIKGPQPNARAARRYSGPGFQRVKPEGFNEPDVSDKPRSGREDALTPEEQHKVAKRWRCQGASLDTVDRGIGRMEKVLRRSGELANTVFIFSSDNGAFFGEHRIARGKARIYDPAFRVPLAMRVPPHLLGGTRAPKRIPQEVAQIDLAPTMLELARGTPCVGSQRCRRIDGRSLVTLLEGKANGWPRDRAILMEVDGVRHDPCRHVGLRTTSSAYARTATDGCPPARELYDLKRDPGELHNLARSHSRLGAQLETRLEKLLRCSGVKDEEPRRRGKPFCE
jgi:N-acetylglucosamine-6-sulfatase